ncbi:hypothetical protein OJ965_08610 [Pantoea anthophila]|uniref:hypothetical protein n=1 Tax=Pantoea anthophila TaxID=470931 RepID=UPI00223671E3|nr:hypothetical protein [Pantoea anthophila]UZH04156.1 hypothetical protein OJ965_08610 [Pantoea anthophila]
MLTPIQESVFVLSALKNTFEPALKTFKRYINDDDVKFLLQNKMLIDLYSFQEEWARLNALCATNPEVVLTRKICEPALSRLHKWGGIRDFRNKVLAHGYREELKVNGGGKVNSPADLKKWYFDADVPNSYAEVLLLAEMAYFCMAIFIIRHGDSTKDIDFNYKEETAPKGIQTAQEFDAEMSGFMRHISTLDNSIASSWQGYTTLTEIVSKK